MFRSQRITRALAVASGFAFLLTATVASAGHDDRRRSRRHKVVQHGDYCSARGHDRHDRHDNRYDRHRRHDYRHDNHRGHDRYERRRDSYTCEPCGHRFQSRKRFHRHLSGHHHIPLFALPFVIVKHTLGWIFYG